MSEHPQTDDQPYLVSSVINTSTGASIPVGVVTAIDADAARRIVADRNLVPMGRGFTVQAFETEDNATLRALIALGREHADGRSAQVEPDSGLPGPFLTEAARRLNEHGVTAAYDFPGILRFSAGGRTWATGYTGLHVNDDEGHGDQLHGDEHLTALEHVGELRIERYVAVLLGVIAAADAAHGLAVSLDIRCEGK